MIREFVIKTAFIYSNIKQCDLTSQKKSNCDEKFNKFFHRLRNFTDYWFTFGFLAGNCVVFYKLMV
jgi:hypothetical protein